MSLLRKLLAPILVATCIVVAPSAAQAHRDSDYAGWDRGFDFSWDKPTPAEIKAHGGTFIMGYISPTSQKGKHLSKGLVNSYVNAGIGVGPIYEAGTSRPMGGCSAGKADAAKVNRALDNLGIPRNTTVYSVAVDFDIRPYQYATALAYAECMSAIRGKDLVGVYSHQKFSYYMQTKGYSKIWTTYAWSGGKWSVLGESLRQVHNEYRMGGKATDLDYARDESKIGLYYGGKSPKPTPTPTPPVPTPPDPKPNPGPVVTYTVVKGDTVSGIAKRFGVTVNQIKVCSKLSNVNRIKVGQVLTLRCDGGSPAPKPPSNKVYYKVKKGDTLVKIASKYGTSWRTIQKLNGLRNPNRLRVGQVLRVK